MSRNAKIRRAIWVGLLAALVFEGGVSAAWARAAYRTAVFHGYRISVPASWPVYDLARAPATCVRFNRHALYLGTPSADQRCPARAVGRTEAILISPLSARTSRTNKPRGEVLRTTGQSASYPVPSPGVSVTATWNRHQALVSRILKHRLAARPGPARAGPARAGPARPGPAGAPRAGAARATRRMVTPRATTAQAVYTGLGVDACTAPSTGTMSAWSSSPYRAIGVYIGGLNEGCSQPNLTSTWVGQQSASGWHLIPIYVGRQASGACGCSPISASQASSQGSAAAADAVNQAQALGLGPGNPIYDDMEGYPRTAGNTSAVLSFLSAWTGQLHAEGYLSGVYSSGSSGIADLVGAAGTGYAEPDDIWIGDWNKQATASDPYVPSSQWGNHQRLHQYAGDHNETYGGVTLDVDSDYLDGATADTATPIPDGTFVQVTGTVPVYRIAGGAPMYVNDWTQFGGPQPVQQISQGEFDGLRPFPAPGTFLSTAAGSLYRVAGGAPFQVGNPALFGATPGSITVDPWIFANLASPMAHLHVIPADGTIVEGLPSDTYWTFSGGYRIQVAPNRAAVQVDDASLVPFTVVSQTGGVAPKPLAAARPCVAPRLKHMSLKRTRSTLRRANCRLGKVRRPHHWGRHHLLRVFGQSVAPRSKHPNRFKINIRLI